MCADGGVEATRKFKVEKKICPFDPKSACEIEPEAFNTNVVHTSTMGGQYYIPVFMCEWYTNLPQIYDPRATPNLSSIQAATPRFSVP